MRLTVGTRVGPYEVISRLGAGGMGEVYRARDPQLGRDVAIKVLGAFGGDPDRRARFEREARLLAALNHPNIAVIHGFEHAGAEPALVMELVEGETLAERISRAAKPGSAPMSIKEVVDLASQLAHALQSAHEKGIVHRDLKPSNIKIRPDGTLKVLDFGIAKALADAEPSREEAAVADTRTGVVLGTPAYVSPEQAQGQAVDKRTDIWAFGCVLYEMLAFSSPFHASTAADAIAAVLTREPDWSALPEATPPTLRMLLRRCLEKDRHRRLADIADARFDLAEAESMLSMPPAPHRPSAAHRPSRALVGGVLALLGVILGAAATYVLVRRDTVREPVRFEVAAPPGSDTRIALSPDGRRLAFSALGPGGTDLIWVRDLDRLEATPLPGTDGGFAPFWSPDNRSIGFFAAGSMKRIPAAGGVVQTLVERLRPNAGPAASWSGDDRIVFGQVFGALHVVSANGGEARPATTVNESQGEFGHYSPQFLPDGRHFLYDVGGSDQAGLYVGLLGSAERIKVLNRRVFPATVSSDGFLVFVEDQRLKAQSFDLTRFAVSGDPITLAEGVTDMTASLTGALSYRIAGVPPTQLTWVDRTGKPLGTIGRQGRFEFVALSPDDTRAAVSRDNDIWVIDLVRGTEVRLTNTPDWESFPVWSPDASRILFVRGIGQTMGGTLMRMLSSGAGQAEEVFKTFLAWPVDWSRDGRFVTYFGSGRTNSTDLFVLPMSSPRVADPYLETPAQEEGNRLSPDGRFMVYGSDETGRPEVYVQTYPASGQRWRISPDGGRYAQWRADGRELFFLGPEQTVMAVAVDAGREFRPGQPRPLFKIRSHMRQGRPTFVPASDGQRFLVNALEADVRSPIVVSLNWSPGLND